MDIVDLLTSSIAGQPPRQQTPLPNGPQQQDTEPPPPANDSTAGNRMEMAELEIEMNQGDVTTVMEHMEQKAWRW